MGISTSIISQAVEAAVNQGLQNGVAVAAASLDAQQAIATGTADLIKTALADNSRIEVSETKLAFTGSPVAVSLGPVNYGNLVVSPPGSIGVPELGSGQAPQVGGLPTSENPFTLEPSGTVYSPTVEGDLHLPGSMVRLEDVSLGAVTLTASPQAPVFTAPVLTTSAGDERSHPTLADGLSHYTEVVLVGSAQAVAQAATQGFVPPGP